MMHCEGWSDWSKTALRRASKKFWNISHWIERLPNDIRETAAPKTKVKPLKWKGGAPESAKERKGDSKQCKDGSKPHSVLKKSWSRSYWKLRPNRTVLHRIRWLFRIKKAPHQGFWEVLVQNRVDLLQNLMSANRCLSNTLMTVEFDPPPDSHLLAPQVSDKHPIADAEGTNPFFTIGNFNLSPRREPVIYKWTSKMW